MRVTTIMSKAAILVLLLTFVDAAQATVTEIPFHECEAMICVDIAIDGAKPQTLILDTGNVSSTLKLEPAQASHWKLEPIVQDNKTIADVWRGGEHEVIFGKTKLTGKFLVLDHKAVGDHPLPGDGTLAYTAFKDRVLTIDYQKQLLRLSDATEFDGHALPGKLELITFGKGGPPILVGSPFTVNGKPVRAQIDTCYTGTLLVYDASVNELGLEKHGVAEFFPYTDGGVTMLAASAHNLGFDRIGLGGSEPTIYFVGSGGNPVHQPDALFQATIGNALLKHSVVTLNFHSMKMGITTLQQ